MQGHGADGPMRRWIVGSAVATGEYRHAATQRFAAPASPCIVRVHHNRFLPHARRFLPDSLSGARLRTDRTGAAHGPRTAARDLGARCHDPESRIVIAGSLCRRSVMTDVVPS